MPSFLPSFRTTFRTAATAAGVLLAATGGRAEPAVDERRDDRQADVELRRRLEPLVPSVRAALEGNNKDAQKAALAVAADKPTAKSSSTGRSKPRTVPFSLTTMTRTGCWSQKSRR